MNAGTNEWQRVDDVGCFWWVLRWLLLAWAIVVPYAAMTRSFGWLTWSAGCVALGGWMVLRSRWRRPAQMNDMRVELSHSDLHAGEPFGVSLLTSGEMAKSVRWWGAEMMAAVPGDDPRAVVNGEFAIEPDAEVAPVSELQMILTVPQEIRSVGAREWWVQVTVETAHGRMESGRVKVRVE